MSTATAGGWIVSTPEELRRLKDNAVHFGFPCLADFIGYETRLLRRWCPMTLRAAHEAIWTYGDANTALEAMT